MKNKKKYLFYNDELKILVFVAENPRFYTVFVPSSIERVINAAFFATDVLLANDSFYDLFLLHKQLSAEKNFKCINNKLIPYFEEKEYYAKYMEFNEEECEFIYEHCQDHGLIPHLVSIEELYALVSNEKVKIDKGIYNAALKLRRKINYED